LANIIDVTNFFIAIANERDRTLYFPYYVVTIDEDFSTISDFDPEKSLTGFVVFHRKPLLLKRKASGACRQRRGVGTDSCDNYAKFRKSAMSVIYDFINEKLMKWARRKYKQLLRRKKRSGQWLRKLYLQHPRLFSHWRVWKWMAE
jgi:hypothetical protein